MLPHWKENDLMVNGIKIHYTRTGDGSKPPVVLVHGYSDNGKCWLPVAMALETEYDLILPDARGHGLSARVQPGDRVDMVADLAGLILMLGLDRPVVGGHSMGGSVSTGLGAIFPGLARALILEDPGWWDPKPPQEEKAAEKKRQMDPFSAWLITAKDKPLEELMAKCRRDSPTWAEIELPVWAESKKQFDPGFLQAERSPERDWRKDVRALACPTLLITSEVKKGAIISPETAREAVALNHRIQVVNIDGAGHNIRRENYRDYMHAVKAFLASCWK